MRQRGSIMSGKRPSLAESMRAVAAEPPAPQPVAAPPAGQAERAAERPKGFYAATRAGKKKATATLSNEAHRQLKALAVDQGGKIEGLLTEAINDLFRKYGKPPIA
jgi:hypothetical protein